MSVPACRFVERLTLAIGRAEVGLVGMEKTKDCGESMGQLGQDNGQRSPLGGDRRADCRVTRQEGEFRNPPHRSRLPRKTTLIPACDRVLGDGVRGARPAGLNAGTARWCSWIEVELLIDRVHAAALDIESGKVCHRPDHLG